MKVLFWLPRIISICFVLFLSLFSLDVFTEYTGIQAILAFIMHLRYPFLLLLLSLIAWKYDLFGAVIFLGFAVFYILTVGLNRPWSWYVSISGPSVFVGMLYAVSWRNKKKLNQTRRGTGRKKVSNADINSCNP